MQAESLHQELEQVVLDGLGQEEGLVGDEQGNDFLAERDGPGGLEVLADELVVVAEVEGVEVLVEEPVEDLRRPLLAGPLGVVFEVLRAGWTVESGHVHGEDFSAKAKPVLQVLDSSLFLGEVCVEAGPVDL